MRGIYEFSWILPSIADESTRLFITVSHPLEVPCSCFAFRWRAGRPQARKSRAWLGSPCHLSAGDAAAAAVVAVPVEFWLSIYALNVLGYVFNENKAVGVQTRFLLVYLF